MTRDGLFLIENGEIVGPVQNFRWNDGPARGFNNVTMLGHPTGRLLLARDAYAVDLDAVIEAAARAGTMIEINANPHRLDLDDRHCRRAKVSA